MAEWEDNNGDNATYSNLISVFKRASNQQLADLVKRLGSESTPETGPRGQFGMALISPKINFNNYIIAPLYFEL